MGNIITLKTDVVCHFVTGAPTGLKNPSGHLLAGTIYVKVPANAESTKITLRDGTSTTGSFSSGGGWPGRPICRNWHHAWYRRYWVRRLNSIRAYSTCRPNL